MPGQPVPQPQASADTYALIRQAIENRRQVLATYRGHYRYFQTFISVAAKSKGYAVLEVETLFQSRYAGTSFLAGRRAWPSQPGCWSWGLPVPTAGQM